MDSMTMMIAAGTHRGIYVNGRLVGVEPVIQERCLKCHQARYPGCAQCRHCTCSCQCLSEADNYYAELKARLDERAPA